MVSDGHTVETDADGREGRANPRGKIDLVLVDRAMAESKRRPPLTETIKKLDPDMPVILGTGSRHAGGTITNDGGEQLILSKPSPRRPAQADRNQCSGIE